MNLERPRPNSRIIIWDGSDNSTIRYSDYLLCEVDENLKLTILDVGTYPEEDEAQDSLNFDSKYVDATDYSDYQHMDFDDICTGFEDEFNDWAYEDEFVLPKLEEDEDEVEDFDESKISAIKRFKEGIVEVSEEDVRETEEEITKDLIGDEVDVDLSPLTDEELDSLVTRLYPVEESIEDFVAGMRLAESTDELTIFALQKQYGLTAKEAEELLADMND